MRTAREILTELRNDAIVLHKIDVSPYLKELREMVMGMRKECKYRDLPRFHDVTKCNTCRENFAIETIADLFGGGKDEEI